ncbi:hypothetical protein VDGE_30663 [Verticillium dahliae]|uniref:Uncharacterized protein n=1 Tax=Verticillium dahliae TaxID=27337 RepID=A0A444SB80_VERDA|nr:hypothetical protein VDGE_30663 [Verticillium dahliae]
MSRALEKEVVAFLKSGDHTAVYEDISRALAPPDDPSNDPAGLLEIEILGRSHPTPPGQNLLQDKNAIEPTQTQLNKRKMTSSRPRR